MQRSTIVVAVAIILVAFLLYRTRKTTPTVAGGGKKVDHLRNQGGVVGLVSS